MFTGAKGRVTKEDPDVEVRSAILLEKGDERCWNHSKRQGHNIADKERDVTTGGDEACWF